MRCCFVFVCCCCYHKGTYFQANHNHESYSYIQNLVVVATTKVHIFKQITTVQRRNLNLERLLLLPQRYIFSSKSQRMLRRKTRWMSCCCYHKGTYFQANHNRTGSATNSEVLLLLPQRYIFSSKSQLGMVFGVQVSCCCCYHKGTYFQANHNRPSLAWAT